MHEKHCTNKVYYCWLLVVLRVKEMIWPTRATVRQVEVSCMEDRIQHGLEEQEVTLERDHECKAQEQTHIICVFDGLALKLQACEEKTTQALDNSITFSFTWVGIWISGDVKWRCHVVSIHKRDREVTSCSAPAGGTLTRGLFH